MAEEKQDNTEKDLLIANSVYPEAEPIFTFRLKSLASIKDSCDVVLDTNALLVPYTISRESLEQIRKTCESLVAQKRLVIPGQVAREFAKHRANKLGELYQQLSSKRDGVPSIQKGVYPLLEPLTQYQDSLQLEVQINKALGDYREALTKVLDQIRTWTWDDPVSLIYSELFTSDAIVDPSFDDADVLADLDRRKRNNIPPGYKDSGVGDLLIWKTILKVGSLHKRSIIFVSGDEKADWYHQSNRQPLYPRYELIDEFRRHSDGQSLHIVRFSSFLNLYGASEAVVEEVRKEEVQPIFEEGPQQRDLGEAALAAETAVIRFLASALSSKEIIKDDGGGLVDYVMLDANRTKTNVVVKYGRAGQTFLRRLEKNEAFRDQLVTALSKEGESVMIALVGSSRASATALAGTVRKIDGKVPHNVSIFCGYVASEGDFTMNAII